MQIEALSQVIISGVLIGFVYALPAVGLSLIWGLMEIVNFAHGDFIMIGMYIVFWLWSLFNIDPLLGLPIAAILLFMVGVLTYRIIIKRVLHASMVTQIFATFGLGLVLRSSAQFLWSANYRMIDNPIASGMFKIGNLVIGIPQLIAGVVALAITLLLYIYISYSETGRALTATSENREVAELMGIDTHRMFALGWGIGGACVGASGALLAMYYYIYPEVGLMFGTISFIAVAFGGFGSFLGTFLAAVALGIIQVAGSFYISTAYKLAFVYALYLIVVVSRPRGLFGRW